MLLIGVAGTELTAQERGWLQHDAVAGVVLFKRNFASRAQVVELTAAIRSATARPLLIAVDQEGGRVQRSARASATCRRWTASAGCTPPTRRPRWRWPNSMPG